MEKSDGPMDGGDGLAERLRRGDVFAPDCPSREVMRHVTSSWGVLVLIALRDGTMRFSALRRRVRGISERMLSQTLQWLENDGLVRRRAYPVVPPHTDYTLTPLGEEAAEHVEALAQWIEERMPLIMAARADAEQAAIADL
jgi:DNA-binding HxlR family transcriptional regulator